MHLVLVNSTRYKLWTVFKVSTSIFVFFTGFNVVFSERQAVKNVSQTGFHLDPLNDVRTMKKHEHSCATPSWSELERILPTLQSVHSSQTTGRNLRACHRKSRSPKSRKYRWHRSSSPHLGVQILLAKDTSADIISHLMYILPGRYRMKYARYV